MLTAYLFELPDGSCIEVLRPEGAFGYEGWVVRIWNEEFPATKVDRYRDGGTTYVKCRNGTLYSPAPGRKDRGGPEWRPIDGGCLPLKDITPRKLQHEASVRQALLQKLYDAAYKARNNPSVDKWAHDHALDGTASERAIRLNQKLRDSYVFDACPTVEEMLNPVAMLATEGSWRGDADDAAIMLGAAAMAIGLQVRFVGQAFPTSSDQICHVCVQIYDDNLEQWVEFDTLFPNKPTPTKTIVIDRPSEK